MKTTITIILNNDGTAEVEIKETYLTLFSRVTTWLFNNAVAARLFMYRYGLMADMEVIEMAYIPEE